MREDTLLLSLGEESIGAWGIAHKRIQEIDPPVVVALPGSFGWEWQTSIWTASHAHLSSFLDDLTYVSAFCGGALHGGWTKPNLPDLPESHMAWLETHWNKAIVTPLAMNWTSYPSSETGPTLYVRDGQALWWYGRCGLACREADVVDEIGHRFQITWTERW